MTPEFDAVRESFSASYVGRLVARLSGAGQSAWKTSRTGNLLRLARNLSRAARPEERIKFVGIAVVAAAIVQPIAVAMMPATVVPAMPAVLLVVVAVAGLLAIVMPAQLAGARRSSAIARRLFR